MTDKIPCKKCNELILPQTAEKTGGICMACKQGVRQNINQAKEFYRKQKEYDPYRELWKSLLKKVHSQENGFERLTEEEKLYYAVGIFDGEVYNGGIEQFFSNFSGELYSDVAAGLKTLKAGNSLSLLEQAAKVLFGDTTPSKDRLQRYDSMKQFPPYDSEPKPEWAVKLDEIDKQYYEDSDSLSELLTNFAESTGLLEPFKRNNQ